MKKSGVLVGLVILACVGKSAPAFEPISKACLRSPWFGDKKEYTLPRDDKPNLVFPVSPNKGLIRLDLIRALRFIPLRFGDRLPVVLVLVNVKDEDPIDIVERANEINSLLKAGLRQEAKLIILKDESGAWYKELGTPALPHGLFVDSDGEIRAREIFQGVPSLELDRIAALIEHKPPPNVSAHSIYEPDPALRKHALFKAVSGVPLLKPPRSEQNERQSSDRPRPSQLLDYLAIVKAMASADAESAKDVLRSYCEKTTSLVIARRFSSASVEIFGSKACPWAQPIIDSAADAGAGPTFHNLEGMSGFTNGSNELGAHVVVESALVSLWNNAAIARSKHSFLLEPGAKGTLFDDAFQRDNAGWGDYLVRSEITVTMNRGKYPRATYLPAITRTTQEAVTFAPHAEHYDPSLDPVSQPWTTDAEQAFTSALNALQRQAFLAVEKLPPPTRKKKPADFFDFASSALGGLGGWYAERTGPSSLVGRPLPMMAVQRWVHPLEGVDEKSPTRMPNGNILLLDFMFTGCMPCREALPGLSALYDKYHSRGLIVVSVCPSWGQSGIHGLLDRLKATHPVAVLEKDAEKALHIEGYPTYVLVDRKGSIRWVGVGGEPAEPEIHRLLDQAGGP